MDKNNRTLKLLSAPLLIFGIFFLWGNLDKEVVVQESEELGGVVMVYNQGGSMEGHTPRGFAGTGSGLFVGDNLNAGFPDGDGVQMFLTFNLNDISVNENTSIVLRSKNARVEGTPLEDLGKLLVERIQYDSFSKILWDLEAGGFVCALESSLSNSFSCDVTDAVTQALLRGDSLIQFRVRFEKAGDNDNSPDLIFFNNVNSNINESGLFQLEITSGLPPAVEISREKIRVPVVLYAVRDSGVMSTVRDDENILALFKKSQNIWTQADIEFDVTLEEIILDDSIQQAFVQGKFGSLYTTFPSNDSALRIFFVGTLGRANGLAVAPSLALVADVTTVNDFRATAHEIGHLLGLSHTAPDTNRLLYRGANGMNLIEDEVLRTRENARLLERDLR